MRAKEGQIQEKVVMLIWCREGLYVVEVRLELPKHIESCGEVCFDAHDMMDIMILGMCMHHACT